MKAVILAGGLGTRIAEESHLRPKPMIEIGTRPLLWHIMKGYSQYGINDFIICCGYRGYMIKEYFANYFMHMSDVQINLEKNELKMLNMNVEPWRITLVDTGESTLTGGRLKRIQRFVGDDEAFCFTYGDGVSDINIGAEVEFHFRHGRLATVAGVKPPGRYGALQLDNLQVTGFTEKPRGDGGRINGGFFVLSPKVFSYIDDDKTSWEAAPLERLSAEGQLMAYEHDGFWQPMDTLRDKNQLEELWASGKAPWKCWD
jgi:glucose-1-phosphate cytidylyltransferase